MKPVKTLPKFKCDFCKRRSTKSAMERHEKVCFRNPNRYCEYCDNRGETDEVFGDVMYDGDGGLHGPVPCPWCSREDKAKTTAIDKYYEEKNKPLGIPEAIENQEVPF